MILDCAVLGVTLAVLINALGLMLNLSPRTIAMLCVAGLIAFGIWIWPQIVAGF